MKMIPDPIEELEVDSNGKSLDRKWLRLIPNELDEHALEQALILKEKNGGSVTVLAIDVPELDKVLFASVAKGVDRVIKLVNEHVNLTVLTASKLFSSYLKDNSFDLILIGVQANDDLDGELGPFLSAALDLPFVGVTTGISINSSSKSLSVIKAFASGLQGEFEVPIPAILGVQSAEKPPRYVPVAKIRKAKKTANIESFTCPKVEEISHLDVIRMYPPEVAEGAEMIEGSSEEKVLKICDILTKEGLL
jgi:electron transfer flavoprotein beta subunit